MFMQEAFEALLGLLDVYDMGGGLLHVCCLQCRAQGTRSIFLPPEYTS